ncbi:MAG: hypothetical protein DRI84_05155 [Bacteroidetes bacterium]|nr:MAG: hypothetical protein DRI84_05155 [Bacteroidota bacterium]
MRIIPFSKVTNFFKYMAVKNTLRLLLVLLLSFSATKVYAQDKEPQDTTKKTMMQKFSSFNKKAENLFKVLPFPMITYATETGTVFGLVKYNIIDIVESDTISTPSSFSELISLSTKMQFKLILGTTQYYLKDKVLLKSEVQYIEYPDIILGVGNDVSREDVEQIQTQRIVFHNEGYVSFDKDRDLYFGALFNYTNYLDISFDSNSFFLENKYPGYLGGISSGLGFGLILDKRDHRYNASHGLYIAANIIDFDGLLGSYYNFYAYEIDIRQYWNPWYKHVIAAQVYTQGNVGNVPFYSLSQMGGTERMRGYYYGAIRDKLLMDAQIEYRMPVWNIFGVVAFASAGRVANDWSQMDLDDLWYAAGFGLRILVDRKNKANLRIDFGYGQEGSTTLVLGFTEAF